MKTLKIRTLSGNFISVDVSRCNTITIEELCHFGGWDADSSLLASFRGVLHKVWKSPSGSWHLEKNGRIQEEISLNDSDGIYAAAFDILSKGNWYPAFLVGGYSAADVSAVVSDPDNKTGLCSPHNAYMWGGGAVELEHEQIEGARMWLSDPITDRFFDR